MLTCLFVIHYKPHSPQKLVYKYYMVTARMGCILLEIQEGMCRLSNYGQSATLGIPFKGLYQ